MWVLIVITSYYGRVTMSDFNSLKSCLEAKAFIENHSATNGTWGHPIAMGAHCLKK